jgi:hypothetical protein
MARFAIVNQFAIQRAPAEPDQLKSPYLLFVCQFDGASPRDLVTVMMAEIPDVVNNIWRHCFGLPTEASADGYRSVDAVTTYLKRCQLANDLFLVDQPEASVADILRALCAKQRFSEFIARHQGGDAATVQVAFTAFWKEIETVQPTPGSI